MTSFQRMVVGKKFKDIHRPSENIYNLIQPGSTELFKRPPRYQSMYSSDTRRFYEERKRDHQTMGFAKTPLKSPKDFLKKQSRDSNKSVERIPFVCLNKGRKKPPIPKREETSILIHETPGRDFPKMNILTAMKTPALRPAPKAVDTRKGDVFYLEYSGLVPKFCMKQEFGKTPRYLVKRRKNLENCRRQSEILSSKEKPHVLSEKEKIKLIEGLRANWEELNTRYLSLPLVIDTKVLKSRKLDLEKKLSLLEHDIYFLENNKDIDIYIIPE